MNSSKNNLNAIFNINEGHNTPYYTKKILFLKFVMYYNVLCLKVKTTFVNYYFSSVDSLELYI